MAKTTTSQAMELLSTVWKFHARGSWRTLNRSMREALHIAIDGKMKFSERDFVEFRKQFNSVYWIGDSIELVYSRAAQASLSAARSIEAMLSRKPWIYKWNSAAGVRLAVGDKVLLEDYLWTITNFDDTNDELMLTRYHKSDSNKVAGRKRLGRKEFEAKNREWTRSRQNCLFIDDIKPWSAVEVQVDIPGMVAYRCRLALASDYLVDGFVVVAPGARMTFHAETLAEALAGIEQKLRLQNPMATLPRSIEVSDAAKDVFVTIRHSTDAGNCEMGTRAFADKFFPRRKKVKVKELLPKHESREVIAACRRACLDVGVNLEIIR